MNGNKINKIKTESNMSLQLERSKHYLFKISIIGNYNTTKTLQKNKYLENWTDTPGMTFASKEMKIENKIINNQYWVYPKDSIPQDRNRLYFWGSLTRSLGVILMYDITNSESLVYLHEYCRMINEGLSKSFNPVIILLGINSDLEESREVSKADAEKFKEVYNIPYSMETPLKIEDHLEKILQTLERLILEKFKF